MHVHARSALLLHLRFCPILTPALTDAHADDSLMHGALNSGDFSEKVAPQRRGSGCR